jgi:pantothenate synthetase
MSERKVSRLPMTRGESWLARCRRERKLTADQEEIAVEIARTLDLLDDLAASAFGSDVSEARQQRALLHRLMASLASESVSDKARRAARARWAKEPRKEDR